jgi:hypothetical protein
MLHPWRARVFREVAEAMDRELALQTPVLELL